LSGRITLGGGPAVDGRRCITKEPRANKSAQQPQPPCLRRLPS